MKIKIVGFLLITFGVFLIYYGMTAKEETFSGYKRIRRIGAGLFSIILGIALIIGTE